MSNKYYVLSAPNYTIGSHDLSVIEQDLARSCCNSCMELHLEEFGHLPSSVEDYLWTPCGAEYILEDFESWKSWLEENN